MLPSSGAVPGLFSQLPGPRGAAWPPEWGRSGTTGQACLRPASLVEAVPAPAVGPRVTLPHALDNLFTCTVGTLKNPGRTLSGPSQQLLYAWGASLSPSCGPPMSRGPGPRWGLVLCHFLFVFRDLSRKEAGHQSRSPEWPVPEGCVGVFVDGRGDLRTAASRVEGRDCSEAVLLSPWVWIKVSAGPRLTRGVPSLPPSGLPGRLWGKRPPWTRRQPRKYSTCLGTQEPKLWGPRPESCPSPATYCLGVLGQVTRLL